jgi:hypothetical protein
LEANLHLEEVIGQFEFQAIQLLLELIEPSFKYTKDFPFAPLHWANCLVGNSFENPVMRFTFTDILKYQKRIVYAVELQASICVVISGK